MEFQTLQRKCSSSFLALAFGLALTTYSGSLSASSQQKTQGAALFSDKGCAHCHGPSGFGGSNSGPDLSRVRKELKAPEIVQQIHDGGNNMPPFGDELSDNEIKSLVAYLRSKRKPPPGLVKPQATAPSPKPASDPN